MIFIEKACFFIIREFVVYIVFKPIYDGFSSSYILSKYTFNKGLWDHII